eukprot:g3262.t1
MQLSDLNADGDSKLLVATADRHLKIYKGTQVISEHALLDSPVAICSFLADDHRPRCPAVAVASGSYVFIYRNLRPYFKFTLPSVEVDAAELAVWKELADGAASPADAHQKLSAAREKGVELTTRSRDFLSQESPAEQAAFAEAHAKQRLIQQTCVTCMGTLKKNLEDDDAISSLVIGTENKQVLVLDPPGSTVLQRCTLRGVPVMMAITGLYDVDFRIVVAGRDGNIYTIKNGEVMGTVIQLETQICGLVRLQKNILVGCVDQAVHSFHIKGKKNYSLLMPAPIRDMRPLLLKRTRMVNLLLVGLANGEVRLYSDKSLIYTLKCHLPVSCFRFGAFGREDCALCLVHSNGALTVKILKRQAKLEPSGKVAGPPPEQDVPLNVPKKTKLYVEQTQRERDQATEMHRIFQRDLCKLRLNTARSYVKMIADGQGPVSYSAGVSLRLNARVRGIGPRFQIKLDLQNTGSKVVPITIGYYPKFYRVERSLLSIPLLVPGLLHTTNVDLECVEPTGAADVIRVYVCSSKSMVPTISAVVNMPMSEVWDE